MSNRGNKGQLEPQVIVIDESEAEIRKNSGSAAQPFVARVLVSMTSGGDKTKSVSVTDDEMEMRILQDFYRCYM